MYARTQLKVSPPRGTTRALTRADFRLNNPKICHLSKVKLAAFYSNHRSAIDAKASALSTAINTIDEDMQQYCQKLCRLCSEPLLLAKALHTAKSRGAVLNIRALRPTAELVTAIDAIFTHIRNFGLSTIPPAVTDDIQGRLTGSPSVATESDSVVPVTPVRRSRRSRLTLGSASPGHTTEFSPRPPSHSPPLTSEQQPRRPASHTDSVAEDTHSSSDEDTGEPDAHERQSSSDSDTTRLPTAMLSPEPRRRSPLEQRVQRRSAQTSVSLSVSSPFRPCSATVQAAAAEPLQLQARIPLTIVDVRLLDLNSGPVCVELTRTVIQSPNIMLKINDTQTNDFFEYFQARASLATALTHFKQIQIIDTSPNKKMSLSANTKACMQDCQSASFRLVRQPRSHHANHIQFTRFQTALYDEFSDVSGLRQFQLELFIKEFESVDRQKYNYWENTSKLNRFLKRFQHWLNQDKRLQLRLLFLNEQTELAFTSIQGIFPTARTKHDQLLSLLSARGEQKQACNTQLKGITNTGYLSLYHDSFTPGLEIPEYSIAVAEPVRVQHAEHLDLRLFDDQDFDSLLFLFVRATVPCSLHCHNTQLKAVLDTLERLDKADALDLLSISYNQPTDLDSADAARFIALPAKVAMTLPDLLFHTDSYRHFTNDLHQIDFISNLAEVTRLMSLEMLKNPYNPGLFHWDSKNQLDRFTAQFAEKHSVGLQQVHQAFHSTYRHIATRGSVRLSVREDQQGLSVKKILGIIAVYDCEQLQKYEQDLQPITRDLNALKHFMRDCIEFKTTMGIDCVDFFDQLIKDYLTTIDQHSIDSPEAASYSFWSSQHNLSGFCQKIRQYVEGHFEYYFDTSRMDLMAAIQGAFKGVSDYINSEEDLEQFPAIAEEGDRSGTPLSSRGSVRAGSDESSDFAAHRSSFELSESSASGRSGSELAIEDHATHTETDGEDDAALERSSLSGLNTTGDTSEPDDRGSAIHTSADLDEDDAALARSSLSSLNATGDTHEQTPERASRSGSLRSTLSSLGSPILDTDDDLDHSGELEVSPLKAELMLALAQQDASDEFVIDRSSLLGADVVD